MGLVVSCAPVPSPAWLASHTRGKPCHAAMRYAEMAEYLVGGVRVRG